MRGWHDVLPREVLLLVFHLASATRLLDESIRETFHLAAQSHRPDVPIVCARMDCLHDAAFGDWIA